MMGEPLEPAAKLAMRQRLYGQAAHRAYETERARDGADCQKKPVAHLQGHAQTLDCGTHLCLAGKNRRLWKTCKRPLHTSLQFVHPAFLALLVLKTMSGSQQYLRRITCCQSTSETRQAFPAASTPMPDGGLESVQSPFHVYAPGSRRALQPGPSVLARGAIKSTLICCLAQRLALQKQHLAVLQMLAGQPTRFCSMFRVSCFAPCSYCLCKARDTM